MRLSLILIALICLQFSTFLIAQTSQVDSLYSLIENYEKQDTHRVSLILEYAKVTYSEDFDTNIQLLQEAIEISEKYNYLQGIGDANDIFCSIYLSKSSVELALKHGLKAEEIYRKTNNIEDLLSVNTNLARVYIATDDFESALKMHLKNVELVDSENLESAKGRIYYYTGNSYSRLDNHAKAEEYYLKSKAISIELKDKRGEIASNGALANIYNNSGQFEKAIPIAKETLDFATKINSQSMIGASNKVLAESYGGLEKYKEAIEYNDKALVIYKELGRLRILEDIYNYGSNYYEGLGDYKSANEFLKLYNATRDENFPIEKAKIVEDLKTKYETDKIEQEKELAEANAEIQKEKAKRSRILSLRALLFAGIVTLLVAYIFNRLKKIRKQKKELDYAYSQLEEAKKNELAVSNLKALQSQMNPHFIFNALNSVQDLVLLKDIRNSNRYLGKFSDLIRKILLSSKEQFISLEEEIEILSLYLDLEKLRFGEDFKVQLECNVSEEQQEEIQLPAMFIQPYIENAIKHGLFHKAGEKELLVQFSLEERPTQKPSKFKSYLKCIVQDNGIGQERAAEMKIKNLHLHTGFSTEAINERIRLLNETLDQKIELKVEDLIENNQPKGTKVVLHFPI